MRKWIFWGEFSPRTTIFGLAVGAIGNTVLAISSPVEPMRYFFAALVAAILIALALRIYLLRRDGY